MLKLDHQSDAIWSELLQSYWTEPAKLSVVEQEVQRARWVWLDGRWAGDPIEQIKITNGAVHKLRSLELFPPPGTQKGAK